MLIKYQQNYNFYIFYFVSLEVGTATIKKICVMIPSFSSHLPGFRPSYGGETLTTGQL